MSSCRKSVFQVCRDRLYVFDSGCFSWNLFLNCDSGFAFYFERELYFSLTRKTVFSKKTALSCIFFRISIDNLGPYMCYVINTQQSIQPNYLHVVLLSDYNRYILNNMNKTLHLSFLLFLFLH